MSNINQLESLKVLKAVVENGSFTAASKKLNLSTARVSKAIERLESELGTVLFHRSTRHMQITDDGERCYARAINLINQWQDLKEELIESQHSPKGNLRIGVPMTWGLSELAPILDEFILKYPDIRLDVQLNDQHVNVLEEDLDLVLRLTHQLIDSSLICRKLTEYRLIPCASPAYIKDHGEPQHPLELKEHACLMYNLAGNTRKWRFFKGQKPIDVYLEPLLLSNNSELFHSTLLAGRGIALIPEFVVSDDLNSQRLVPILKNFDTLTLNLYSLRPGSRTPSSRLQVFHDFLCKHLKKVNTTKKQP
ncbi:LysR substrate-binding domain-containing protein [Neptuniibacter sp. QD29_5]|uniref:LysR family transcriptional regulator n=1 Tax=Neptuniibacter sp. QD29_5 TaxID=3398207 RepID=UPI0039F5315E